MMSEKVENELFDKIQKTSIILSDTKNGFGSLKDE